METLEIKDTKKKMVTETKFKINKKWAIIGGSSAIIVLAIFAIITIPLSFS
jgi:hypothetical protein